MLLVCFYFAAKKNESNTTKTFLAMKLKKEFLRRLWKLNHELNWLFDIQYHGNFEVNHDLDINPQNLFPRLYSVISYLWTSKNAEK